MKSRTIPVEVVDDTLPAGQVPARLNRLRRLSWLLDRSIPVGGKARFGLDPILGLIPGIGDWIASLLSFYVLYEGIRLGLPARALWKMGFNIALESIVGTVPVVGDAFDFVWQANTRNLALVEKHYHPGLRPRPIGRLVAVVALAAFLLLVLTFALAFLLARALWQLFT